MGRTKSNNASKRPMVREKESFRYQVIVNVDQTDTRLYVKCVVNYERLTYKIQPVITLVHKWGEEQELEDSLLNAIGECKDECESRLATYRNEVGLGNQGDMFAQEVVGEPSSN